MNKTLLSNNNHPNISLTCQKFQYGGGMERYLIDIVMDYLRQTLHLKFTLPSLILHYLNII